MSIEIVFDQPKFFRVYSTLKSIGSKPVSLIEGPQSSTDGADMSGLGGTGRASNGSSEFQGGPFPDKQCLITQSAAASSGGRAVTFQTLMFP